ncbi:MAG: hypothetical protein JHC84_05105 [Solirubrobacteraceae bacterium]|nr:hypothetical protein [Solirubrobacteraceae bacterium]
MAAVLALPGVAVAAPEWRLEQPPPPPGAPGQGPVGQPADLQFLAPNFGLMLVDNEGLGGRNLFASGLLVFDGTGWRQLATVCGGPARSSRIALVSETEWWTTSRAVNELDGRVPTDGAATLCHFRDGVVASSYATALTNTLNPYPDMNAAACLGPADCWFGGPVVSTPNLGTFLLHWNGSALTPRLHPRARAVADMEPLGGSVVAPGSVGSGFDGTSFALDGTELRVQGEVDPFEPNGPQLLRRLQGGAVSVLDWPRIDEVEQLVDIRVADSAGGVLWLAGRDSQSYVAESEDGPFPQRRAPYLARMRDGDAEPTELTPGEDGLQLGDVVSDLAVLPGGEGAWAAIQTEPADRSRAIVARLGADGEVLERRELRRPDLEVGQASRIACPAVDQCWMVTTEGWVYRLSEPGLVLPQNTSPAIQRLITVRPRDERTPTLPPDTLVRDETPPFVAPPAEPAAPPVEAVAPKPLPSLLRVIGKPKIVKTKRGRRIHLRIQVRRRARVQLVGRRGGRTVARTATKTYRPGRYTLRMKASVRRWPTALRFVTRDLELPQGSGGGGEDDAGGGTGDTVTT